MKICEIDKAVKEVIEDHHVYGAECIINAIARASLTECYLSESELINMIKNAFVRIDLEV